MFVVDGNPALAGEEVLALVSEEVPALVGEEVPAAAGAGDHERLWIRRPTTSRTVASALKSLG